MLRSRLAHQEAFQEQDARRTHCKGRNQVSTIKTVQAILILTAFIFLVGAANREKKNPSSGRVGPRLSAWLCACVASDKRIRKKIVICLPTKHLRVLKNSFKRVRPFQTELEFEVLVFEEREKPKYREKNLPQQRKEPTTNLTHTWHRHRNMNPRPHW